MALNEYTPGTAFPGVIGRTTDESTPARAAPTNQHIHCEKELR